jgi:hypothetical protein
MLQKQIGDVRSDEPSATGDQHTHHQPLLKDCRFRNAAEKRLFRFAAREQRRAS